MGGVNQPFSVNLSSAISELIDIKDLLNPRRVLIHKLWESYGSINFFDTYITGELLIEAFQRTLTSGGRIYADRDDCEYVLKLRPGIHLDFIYYRSQPYRSLEMSNGSEFEQDKRRDFASV